MKHQARTFSDWINEKVEYHKELCPKIWDDERMIPEIRTTLLKIAEDFWNSLKLEVPIIDVQLTGSLANYNWNPDSDLDVHIIIDFAKVDENVGLVRKALDGQRFMWNQRHPVVLKGHDVECYIQHKDEQHTASGLYSLLNGKWITVPKYSPPQIDQKDVAEKKRVIQSELQMIKNRAKRARDIEAKILYEYVERIKKKVQADRKRGLAEGGEFSVENLVFKELRREGTIEKMIDLMSELYSKIYSY